MLTLFLGLGLLGVILSIPVSIPSPTPILSNDRVREMIVKAIDNDNDLYERMF